MVSCVQLHLMKAAAEAGGSGGRGDGIQDPGCEQGLGGTLARAIVMCVCTVSASMEVKNACYRVCRVESRVAPVLSQGCAYVGLRVFLRTRLFFLTFGCGGSCW